MLHPRFNADLRFDPTNAYRRGAATIELAFALILLVILTVGSIEVCNLIYLKQSLAQTAYDGGLRAMRPNIDEADVHQHIDQLLSVRHISGAIITVSGDTEPFDDVDRGESFIVRIRAPTAGNVSVTPWILNIENLEAEVVGRKQ